MALGIEGYADLEIADPADACDQFRRGLIAVGMGPIGAGHVRHVAAQSDDMADARIPIGTDNVVDLATGMADASEMRGRLEAGFLDDALDGVMRALARAAARAIGDRDEGGGQRLQPLDRA